MKATRAAPAGPTPDQIAQHGHIAAALRKALAERGWNPGDLNEALGKQRSDAGIYNYLGAKQAPAPKAREALSKTLGLPEAVLLRRHPNAGPAAALMIEGPVQKITQGPPVLSFAVDDTGGMATLKLHVYRPVGEVVPLLRLLLEAGAIVKGGMD